jgi:hypothetical protein
MGPSRGIFLWNGGIAQLGERLLCKQEVIGSIPFASTSEPAFSLHLQVENATSVGKIRVRFLAVQGTGVDCHRE